MNIKKIPLQQPAPFKKTQTYVEIYIDEDAQVVITPLVSATQGIRAALGKEATVKETSPYCG